MNRNADNQTVRIHKVFGTVGHSDGQPLGKLMQRNRNNKQPSLFQGKMHTVQPHVVMFVRQQVIQEPNQSHAGKNRTAKPESRHMNIRIKSCDFVHRGHQQRKERCRQHNAGRRIKHTVNIFLTVFFFQKNHKTADTGYNPCQQRCQQPLHKHSGHLQLPFSNFLYNPLIIRQNSLFGTIIANLVKINPFHA